MKKEAEILSYHQKAVSLFSSKFDWTLQSPFWLTPLQMKNLKASVGHMHRFLQKSYRPEGLFLARPEFIRVGDEFKLIDLNVSASITSFSYNACLRYWQNHPLTTAAHAPKKAEAMDFDRHLARALTSACKERKAKALLILEEPFELFESSSVEALANASRLQAAGLNVQLVNPRYAKFQFHRGSITCNGVRYKAVLCGFLAKYAFQEKWLYQLLQNLTKSQVLVSDFHAEARMMSKQNLVELCVKDAHMKYSLPTLTLERFLTLPLSQQKKNNWILKHVDGNNSEQVIGGLDVSQSEWRQALSTSKPEEWILQSYQPPKSERLPVVCGNRLLQQEFYPIFSPFVLNGEISGILVKAYTEGRRGQPQLVPGLALPE